MNELRHDSIVLTWIQNYRKKGMGHQHKDCKLCGWPHTDFVYCGAGASFGCLKLGGQTVYVDTTNVRYLLGLTERLHHLGFHWKNDVFIRREGVNVVVSRITFFNYLPSLNECRIPVNEFASIVCAASVAVADSIVGWANEEGK